MPVPVCSQLLVQFQVIQHVLELLELLCLEKYWMVGMGKDPILLDLHYELFFWLANIINNSPSPIFT